MDYFLKASMTSVIFGLLLIISPFSFGQNTISLFVSPSGSDTANGTMEQPFASIKRALKLVVEQRTKGKNDAVTIYLRAGTYYRTSATEISEETLGGSNDSKIVIRPYQNEQVVFHGGKKINGGKFKKTKSRSILERLPQESQGKVWAIDLKKEGITNYGQMKQHGFGTPPSPTVMELFINGQPLNWPLAKFMILVQSPGMAIFQTEGGSLVLNTNARKGGGRHATFGCMVNSLMVIMMTTWLLIALIIPKKPSN